MACRSTGSCAPPAPSQSVSASFRSANRCSESCCCTCEPVCGTPQSCDVRQILADAFDRAAVEIVRSLHAAVDVKVSLPRNRCEIQFGHSGWHDSSLTKIGSKLDQNSTFSIIEFNSLSSAAFFCVSSFCRSRNVASWDSCAASARAYFCTCSCCPLTWFRLEMFCRTLS